MFAAWGSWVARFRWPVLLCTLAAVVTAGMWGLGVFGQLTEGGYNDPGSESTRAAEVVHEELGAQGGDVIVIYTPAAGGIDDAGLDRRVRARLGALPPAVVTAVASYWPDRDPRYKAADGTRAVAVLTLAGADEGAKLAAFRQIDDKLSVDGATVQLAGGIPLGDASAAQSTQDLAFAEAVSLPVVLILLLFIFGSLVAAALPVLVGGCAVLGSLGVLHAIAYGSDVNSFAVNVASLLGLGMAIDYGLFMVGRFREEQGFGRTPAEAVARTVATAGRTVVFSATLLMIALAGLMLFPQGFLKSLAYGGLAAVALAALLSLTLLPALLAVLGPRVDKLPVRLPRRRTARPAGTGWSRLAGVVLRHPVLIALPILAGLLVLAAPIAGVRFGENDERILPAGNPARQAIETLKADFPALSSAGIQVVLRGTRGAAPAAPTGTALANAVGGVAGIAAVTPSGSGGDVLLYTATLTGTDPFSPAARDAVAAIRALPAPAGTEVLVGGTTARNVDSLRATADRLPLMVALLVGATLVLMFLAFGSILLPVKAVVLSALSLSATFGILVWIFQDGHGADLLRVTPAPPEAGIVVLMAAVVFGLSTDYEVFLLSRMVEARTRGASTAEAVTTGLARTGRVISAAAILLIVVTGAFALSSLTTMRFIGVGMIVALLLDATVVRMLLVPAVLKLMGEAAWWAPGPLRRLQERAGLQEYEDEELFPTVSVGRHAAPEPGRSGSAAASAGSVSIGSGAVSAGSAFAGSASAGSVSAGSAAASAGSVSAGSGVAGSVPGGAPRHASWFEPPAAGAVGAASAGGIGPFAGVASVSPGAGGLRPDHFSGTASVSPAARAGSTGRFSASAPVSGGTTTGYPIAGAAPEHPIAGSAPGLPVASAAPGLPASGAHAELPIAGSAPLPVPARVTLDEADRGALPSAWPPAAGHARLDPAVIPEDPGMVPPAGEPNDQPATVDLSGRLAPSGGPDRDAGNDQRGDDRRGPDRRGDDRRGGDRRRGEQWPDGQWTDEQWSDQQRTDQWDNEQWDDDGEPGPDTAAALRLAPSGPQEPTS